MKLVFLVGNSKFRIQKSKGRQTTGRHKGNYMAVVTIHQRTLQFGVSVTRFLCQIAFTPESRIIRNQLIRAGCSVGANVVEAQHSVSKKEFLRYMSIALRSARETEYWLNILSAIEINRQDSITKILQENDEISRIIAAIILKSKRKAP